MIPKINPNTHLSPSDYHPICYENDGGSLEGWIRYGDDRIVCLSNWLDSISASEQSRAAVRKIVQQHNSPSVGVVKNLFIEEESRLKGCGSALVNEMLFAAELRDEDDVVLLFLEADTGQEQVVDFSLVDWFEGFGFKRLTDKQDYPIMVNILTT